MEREESVTELVRSAASGDQRAWNELVDRYTPLIMFVVRQYHLGDQDGADVGQTVWLRLVQHLGGLREPAALPGWIRTTTRNECLRVIRAGKQTALSDELGNLPADGPPVDADLVRAERHEALLAGFAELPTAQRELLLLVGDPPLSYAQISQKLGISRGSIGPTRARALQKLRESAVLAAQSMALATQSMLDPKEGETRGITAR